MRVRYRHAIPKQCFRSASVFFFSRHSFATPGAQLATCDVQAFETSQLTRNIALARHREQRLSQSGVLEEPENVSRASQIELGERIVEKKERRASGAVAKGSCLQHSKRDGRRSLLTRRPEGSEVAAVERDDQVIPVGAGVRQSTSHVHAAFLDQRLLECRSRRASLRNR